MHIEWLEAVERLQRGEVVALPTETVYGLAASLSSEEAISAIFRLKNRPQDNPLIIHVAEPIEIGHLALSLPEGFNQLSHAFWPGPLTLVLPIEPSAIPFKARGGLPTAAFRIPSHLLTRQILKKTGPLVMPSANLSGRPSATSSKHVQEDFGGDFPVVDGGECLKGIESTILLYREELSIWEMGRLGAISQEMLKDILGYEPKINKREEKEGVVSICPGQKYRHYAPRAKLIVEEKRGFFPYVVGFSDRDYGEEKGVRVLCLGSSQNPDEAAHRLYQVLRSLDEEGIKEAWVDMDFPDMGLWKSVRERLIKASGS